MSSIRHLLLLKMLLSVLMMLRGLS